MREILAKLAEEHFGYTGEPTPERIHEHVNICDDNELAHIAMDEFLVAVLGVIAEGKRGKKEAAELAQAALTINATDWDRWYS